MRLDPAPIEHKALIKAEKKLGYSHACIKSCHQNTTKELMEGKVNNLQYTHNI